MVAPTPFRLPDLKRALKAAHDMGLAIVGFEIGAGGEIKVHTGTEPTNDADAALEKWKRAHGKGS